MQAVRLDACTIYFFTESHFKGRIRNQLGLLLSFGYGLGRSQILSVGSFDKARNLESQPVEGEIVRTSFFQSILSTCGKRVGYGDTGVFPHISSWERSVGTELGTETEQLVLECSWEPCFPRNIHF